MTRLISVEDDGVTHINVYSKGLTRLGRTLSNFYWCPKPIAYHADRPDLKFRTLEGYWYWLGTGMKYDELAHMEGSSAKMRVRNYPKVPVRDFESRIKNAIGLKIAMTPEICFNLWRSELPLTHYYVVNGSPRHAGFEWITDHITQIRDCYREIMGNPEPISPDMIQKTLF